MAGRDAQEIKEDNIKSMLSIQEQVILMANVMAEYISVKQESERSEAEKLALTKFIEIKNILSK